MKEVDILTTGIISIDAHVNRLRFMYVYTIFTAGIVGIVLLIAPSTMLSLMGAPAEEPFIAGIAYSVWAAFGILSVVGLRSPLKFAPVLLLQFLYKLIWFVAVIFPRLFAGSLPMFAINMSALFVSIVVGDVIAIPWRYLFAK